MPNSTDSTDAAIAALIREWDSAYYYGDRAIDDLAQRIRAFVEAKVGEEREADCRAVCPSCRGGHDVEAAVFQREITGEWAHRWKPEYGHGSRACLAGLIRARTQGGEGT